MYSTLELELKANTKLPSEIFEKMRVYGEGDYQESLSDTIKFRSTFKNSLNELTALVSELESIIFYPQLTQIGEFSSEELEVKYAKVFALENKIFFLYEETQDAVIGEIHKYYFNNLRGKQKVFTLCDYEVENQKDSVFQQYFILLNN